MNIKRQLLITLLSLLTCIGQASASEYIFFNGAAKVNVPSKWQTQGITKKGNAEAVFFDIPNNGTSNNNKTANLLLIAEPNKSKLKVSQYAQWKSSTLLASEGTELLASSIENEQWITLFIKTQQNNTPYLIIERFAATEDHLIMLMAALPISINGNKNDVEWTKTTIEQVNSIIKSINLNGSSLMKSRVTIKDGVAYLSSEPSGEQLIAPFPVVSQGAIIDVTKVKK